jgi:inosine-uridine nucleoside N-ribohydrolase
MTAMMTLAASSLLCLGAPGTPVPVILDTDLGSDIDDTWALGMILGSPEIDVKLITTAFRDTEKKTRLVAKLLEKMGRTDIPIGTGVKTDGDGMNQGKWLGDYDLKNYPGTVHKDGVQALIDTIKASKEPMVLCVLGPQMNIQEALRRDPSIAENARVIAMAGSVHIGYKGNPEPQAEWNIRADVEAARAVFAAPWKIAIAPLDICGALTVQGDQFRALDASTCTRAQAVSENYALWVHRDKYAKDASSILFDTVAVYMILNESLCKMETVKLTIDDKGNTIPDEKGRPVQCALGWKDEKAEPAFKQLLIDSLVKLEGVSYR